MALYNSDYTQVDKERASAAVFRMIANTILPDSIVMVEDVPGDPQHGDAGHAEADDERRPHTKEEEDQTLEEANSQQGNDDDDKGGGRDTNPG